MDGMLMRDYLTRKPARDDRGAAAVMFALCALLLFGVGAMAVDLGNMYQRKAETQSQADLAATSAAPYLKTSHTAAVVQVIDYLKHNAKIGEDAALVGMTPGTMQDGELANGEVQFPSTYSMKVWTPYAHVDFGLAGVFDSSGSDVISSATVGLGTPGANAIMPFYAVQGSGCDYGSQTLSDPANGHIQSIVPALAPPGHDPLQISNASLTSATPYQFDVGVVGATITINGSRLAQVDRIGYFREPGDPAPQFVEATLGTANTNNNAVTGAPVPTGVTNAAGVWWIRVFKPAPGNWGWSPVSEALPIRIGDGPIACTGAASAGNFGALKLPRDAGPSTWLPDNMAVGLQPPLSLAVQTDPLSLPLCTPGGPSVVYSDTSGPGLGIQGTNCVDTDTGLSAQASTQGLITGSGSNPGRLVKDTTTAVPGRGCSPLHTNAERPVLGGSYVINDDTLSCFMTNPSMPLSTIASPSYSGGAVLDPAIYDSPRFAYVPVVGVTPVAGGSLHFSVVAMRPCFITGEANTSTYNNEQFVDGSAASTNNGLTIPTTKVTAIQVVFINIGALPNSGGNATPGVILDPSGPLVPILTD